MSAFKSLFFIICCSIILGGCGQKLLHFEPNEHIGMKLFGDAAHLSEIYPGKATVGQIDNVYAYEAVLKEMVLERNQITDFGLVNELSPVAAIDRHATAYSNRLYFFVFSLTPVRPRIAILMSTSFYKDELAGIGAVSKCVGIGPVYIGTISDSDSLHFNVFRALGLLEASYDEQSNQYVLNKSKRKLETDLQFFMDRPLLSDAPANPARLTTPFSIARVVQSNDNKISGNEKQVVYDIGPLFNDPGALKFSFMKPLN